MDGGDLWGERSPALALGADRRGLVRDFMAGLQARAAGAEPQEPSGPAAEILRMLDDPELAVGRERRRGRGPRKDRRAILQGLGARHPRGLEAFRGFVRSLAGPADHPDTSVTVIILIIGGAEPWEGIRDLEAGS